MKSIITQVATKVVYKIINNIEEIGISEIGKTTEALLPVLKEGTLELLVAAINEMDAAILNAKRERRLDGITIKEKNVPRTVVTPIGDLKFHRTYYEFKDGHRAHIVDQLIGIEPYERVTKELCAELVHNTAAMSMQKAVKISEADISRQTVNNKLLAMRDVVTEIDRASKTPSELHIFADEDHVHLRPKRCAIVPLITVTEGIDATNEKRHKTISPIHFQGYGMTIDAFIEDVVAAIHKKYNMDEVKRVVIHADGGNWIKKLGDLMPKAVYVMDGFHLEKYLKQLFSLNGAMPYAGIIRKSLRENNMIAFGTYCRSIEKKQDERGRKKLRQLVSYFKNNWGSIVERMSGEHCGSCTEPLISHVLSDRLSRNPIAWSQEGLRKMAMLRVYEENGGVVTKDNIRISLGKRERKKEYYAYKSGLKTYRKYAEDQVKAAFGGDHDWSLFEKEYMAAGLRYGKTTGTTILLKACGR